MKKRFLTYGIFIALAGLGITRANAQQTLKIGTNPTTVSNSAVLDVEASNKGVLLPRVALTGTNDVTTIASPANALTVFNTATTTTGTNDVVPGYYYWDASAGKWIQLSIPQDLRAVGNGNHISNDAGVGSNGTSVGTGIYNIAIGQSAFTANTTGASNISIGTEALPANTTGNDNIGLGFYAMFRNSSGASNVALGKSALSGNQTGSANVALGEGSGSNLDGGGNYNTFIGVAAGSKLMSGSGNVFLGANTGFSNINTVASNQLFIGNATGDDALIRGDFATKVLTINNTLKVADLNSAATATTGNRPVVADANGQLKIGAASAYVEPWNEVGTNLPASSNTQNIYQNGSVGIGSTDPTAKSALLHVLSGAGFPGTVTSPTYRSAIFAEVSPASSNEYSLFRGTGGSTLNAGVVRGLDLDLNPAGNASGSRYGFYITNETENYLSNKLGIGTAATNMLHVKATTDPVRLEGLQAGSTNDKIVTADANGVLKTVNRSTFASDLRFVGANNHITQDAGASGNGSGLSGFSNIAIGAQALSSGSYSGSYNTVVGNLSSIKITTGEANSVLGMNALKNTTTGGYNTALGMEAMQLNIDGADNTAVGTGTLPAMTSGNNNTSVGRLAGVSLTNGSTNVFLGNSSGYNLTGGSGNVFIGNSVGLASPASASNQLFIGNTQDGNALIRGDFATKVLTINGNTTSATASPSKVSTLNVNGSVSASIITVTADYTATDTDYTIVVKNSSGTYFNITFPAANTCKGRIYKIVSHPSTPTAPFTLVGVDSLGSPGQTASTGNSYAGFGKFEIQSDGTDWIIINAL